MVAADRKVLNKDIKSVKKLYEILAKYETASGSKINLDKTRGFFMGSLRRQKQYLIKITRTTYIVKI
jgi:hypothetical protein